MVNDKSSDPSGDVRILIEDSEETGAIKLLHSQLNCANPMEARVTNVYFGLHNGKKLWNGKGDNAWHDRRQEKWTSKWIDEVKYNSLP